MTSSDADIGAKWGPHMGHGGIHMRRHMGTHGGISLGHMMEFYKVILLNVL